MRWVLGCVATLAVLVLLVWFVDARIQWKEDRRVLGERLTATPSCYDAWRVDAVLRAPYSGCSQDKAWGGPEIVEPETFDCPPGSGSEYYVAEGGGGGSFAVPGGRIWRDDQDPDASQIADQDLLARVCQPPMPDCFETWRTGRLLPDPYRGCSSESDYERPVAFVCPEGSGGARYISYYGDFATAGGPVLREPNPVGSRRLVDPAAVRRVCDSAGDG